jgi:predicted ArsR family transcriptional regulator
MLVLARYFAAVPTFDPRFLDSTRGQVLTLLRRGSRTIDELARALGVSDNAVRAHVSGLERDGLVRRRGVRPTGGKPAYAYEIAPEAERLFTRAYVPVLTQLVGVLEERLGSAELETILREVGRRLAAAGAAPTGDLRTRADAAAAVLTELGGLVDVEEHDGRLRLSGHSCPLADAVRAHPGTCRAAESLVSELVGRPVQESCDRGERPRCRFDLGEAPPER